jgi:HK97 family phage major capsid protein
MWRRAGAPVRHAGDYMEYKGFTEYEARDFDALDLHLRSIGQRALGLDTLDVQKATWDKLHSTRKAVVKASKATVDLLAETSGEDEARKASAAHDVLMASLDFIDGEMDRRKAHGQTEPLTPAQRGVPISEGGTVFHDEDGRREFVPEGRSAPKVEWRDNRGNPIRVYAPNERIAERTTGRNAVGELAKAMIFGAKNADLSESERRALSEGTDSAGGYTVPTMLASEFIDKLRAKLVVFQAGASTVPMTSDNLAIARVTGDPTVAWTAENAEITASDPTFDAVTLAPKKLTCLVKVSRELLEDSVNISAALEGAIIGAMSVELDRACLFGSGSGSEPTGLFNISGINSVSMGTNGATPSSYDDLIDLLYEVQLDNGADPKSFIMHPRTNRTYAKMKDGNGNPLTEPKMTAEVRRLLTTAVPITQTQGTATGVCSTVLTGDFSKMLVGIRVGLELRMLNERYAEFDQVGFIARLRADVAVENPVHFAKLIGIKP